MNLKFLNSYRLVVSDEGWPCPDHDQDARQGMNLRTHVTNGALLLGTIIIWTTTIYLAYLSI